MKTRWIPTAIVVAIATGAAADPGGAAPSLQCIAAEANSIEVDGLLDDWQGVARARAGGVAADASFDLRCIFDGERVYLSVDIRDERVLRQPRLNLRKPNGNDHLIVTLPGVQLTLFPGLNKTSPVRLLGRKKLTDRAFVIEDTLQPKGWSAELSVPVRRVTGWSPNAATLAIDLQLVDADVPNLSVPDHQIAWAGDLVVGEVTDVLAGFLAGTGLTEDQLTLDVQADIDAAVAGKERVVAGGDVVGVLADHYSFVRLPVERPEDIVKVELIDLHGTGPKLIAAHLRQRHGDMVRDLLTLWTGEDGTLRPLAEIEIGKQRAGKRLRSTWKVEPAKRWKQARGARRVLVVRATAAIGWDANTYQEEPAGNAEAIHLPWSENRVGGVFWLSPEGQLETGAIVR